jgi:two-component system response regulator MtrA
MTVVEWRSRSDAKSLHRGRHCRKRMQILIHEDDESTRDVLREQAGHALTKADSAEAALALLAQRRYDLLVTELHLPDADGIGLLRRVRRLSSIPILVVSGRAAIADRVAALRSGADDYLVKPFDPSELEARIEALLRRARHMTAADSPGLVKAGDISIDLARQVATVAGRGPIRLTPTELRVLLRLARPPGEVRSRAELAQAIWGDGSTASIPAINTYIADLRRKLERERGAPRLLQTVRGIGYRLAT